MEPIDFENLPRLIVEVNEPGVRGLLYLGEPHGVWTHIDEHGVRATLWSFGRLVAVLTPPLRSTGDSLEPPAFR